MANDPNFPEPSAYSSHPVPEAAPPRTTDGAHAQEDTAPANHSGVPPGVEYHRVYAGDSRRIGRGIVALLLLFAGLLVFSIAITFLGAALDAALGNDSAMFGGTEYTPIMHGALLLGIAVVLPWAMFLQRWLYGVPAASLHSVLSYFRWAIFGRVIVVVAPIWAIGITVVSALEPADTTMWELSTLMLLFVITIVITPVQAAAEEYAFRGLAFRVGGSWARGPVSALITGVLVSSVLFMLSHIALDPWLNLYYFIFGATLCVVTWRTGGVEAAVVIHAVNNTLAFLLALILWSDFMAGWDRSVGAGSPVVLLLCVLLVGAAAVSWWTTRRTGPPRTPQPAAAATSPV